MNGLPELLQDIDLAALARKPLALLDTSDPCFLLVVLGLLTFLGSRMASGHPYLLTWGVRLGLAAFLGNLAYVYLSQGGMERLQWPQLVVRSLVAAGLVVAPLWTIVPVLAFVYQRIRLALATFLIYSGYACFTAERLDAEALQLIALRGVLMTALVLLVAWILQPVTDFIGKHLFPRANSQPEIPPTTEPGTAPTRKPDHRYLCEMQRQAESQRRGRARLRAELCYTLHETALGDRFPRYLFEDFLDRYLHDGLPVEQVEENLRELESVIQQYAGTTSQPPAVVEPIAITDLTRWLLEE